MTAANLLFGADGGRPGAPEPTLVAELVQHCSIERLPLAADLARRLAEESAAGHEWPAFADAVSMAIVDRGPTLPSGLTVDLITALPRLATLLPALARESGAADPDAVGTATAARVLAEVASATADAATARRARDLGTDTHPAVRLLTRVLTASVLDDVDAAVSAVLDADRWMPVELYIRALALADHARHRELAAAVTDPGRGDTPDITATRLAATLTVLPPDLVRERGDTAAAALGAGLDRLPPWLGALVIVRLRDRSDPTLLHELTDRLAPYWRPRDGRAMGPRDELRRAHPASADLATRLGTLGPGEVRTLTDDALEQMYGRWGGALAAMAPPPAPPPPPPPTGVIIRGIDDTERPSTEAVEAEPGATPTGERFAQAAITVEGSAERRRSFVAGADHRVVVWIGPHQEWDPRPRGVADRPVPTVPAAGIDLEVVLLWNDQEARDTMRLPGDQSAASNECSLALHVPDGTPFVSADIAFLYRGRAFEMIRFEARAVGSGDADVDDGPWSRVQVRDREVIEFSAREPVDAVLRDDGDGFRMFGTAAGSGVFSLAGAEPAIDSINNELFVANNRLLAADESGHLDHTDETVNALLGNIARAGRVLHQELERQGFGDAERFQVWAPETEGTVPLEYVYDAPSPADDAALCDGWRASLRGTACATCPRVTPPPAGERAQLICLGGFWALQKEIERHVQRSDDAHAAPRSHPTDGRARLPRVTTPVFASASNVRDLDQQQAADALTRTVSAPRRPDSWPEWVAAIRETDPDLLVLFPHHDAAGVGNLVIGSGNDRLPAGELDEEYVTTDPPGEPGPIVLLLGCRTDDDENIEFHRFTRDFYVSRAAIVVGTHAKVHGRHVAPLATWIIDALAGIEQDTRFGTLMLETRRRSIEAGQLLAFALVSYGDADWVLADG